MVTLMPGVTEYTIDVPLSQQSATVTATVNALAESMTIAGKPWASGTPSEPISLALGDNAVEIVVEGSAGTQRAYQLTLRRAAHLAQYAYGKASKIDGMDEFSHAVVMSGDTLAVGVPRTDVVFSPPNSGSGAVYVFRRTGTSWQQEAYLKASNPDRASSFGQTLALSGDTIAVGAPEENGAAKGVNGDPYDDSVYAGASGAVYVFRRMGTSWQQEAYVKASNAGEDDEFGASLALSDDTLVVGAPEEKSAASGVNGDQDDDSVTAAGAVYVFRRTGKSWQQEAYVKAFETRQAAEFGHSVALSRDALAVGVPREGKVYLYRRSGTTWQQEAFVDAGTSAFNEFGHSVALFGNTLAVGDIGYSTWFSGAVHVFRRVGGVWQQDAYLEGSNTRQDDLFGYSVALSGVDLLAVGAPGEDSAATGVDGDQDDNSVPSSGAVYVFRRTDTGWQQEDYVKASNPGEGDFFGHAVSISRDGLAVGALWEDSAATGFNGDHADDSATDSGAVYVFH